MTAQSWDRQRAIRYLKNVETAYDAHDAADAINMAARRLRWDDDPNVQAARRPLRYATDDAPLEELQDIARRARRRIERGW